MIFLRPALGEIAALNTCNALGWRKREIDYISKKIENEWEKTLQLYFSEEEFKQGKKLLRTLTNSELWDHKTIEKIVMEWIESL
jgi:hypothetical protein